MAEETFRALMRLRGVECNRAVRLREAFHGRKIGSADLRSTRPRAARSHHLVPRGLPRASRAVVPVDHEGTFIPVRAG
jgi:hypothetical protein